MVSSKETSPAAYLAGLPADRRAVVEAVRNVVKKRLPAGYVESMNWGMLCYEIPLSRYPDTYNKQPLMYIALAAQKNNYALYMQGVAGFPDVRDRLSDAYTAAGRKFDMGGSCLRFKQLDELPLALIGDIVASTSVEQRIAAAETGASTTTRKAAAKKVSATTPAPKKAVANTSVSKKVTASTTAATRKVATKKVAGKKVATKTVAVRNASTKRK
ncbi:MAG: DUF1801 domain-containing protein [Gemmatimonadaceae bacterium]|nr:DUF1801 domain-containing protein [Gemmatimonadaceae bacterium]